MLTINAMTQGLAGGVGMNGDDRPWSVERIVQRVEARIAELGRSANALALAKGYSRELIASFLKDARRGKSRSPQIDTLSKIADALNWTPAQLLGFDVPVAPAPAREINPDRTHDALCVMGQVLGLFGAAVGNNLLREKTEQMTQLFLLAYRYVSLAGILSSSGGRLPKEAVDEIVRMVRDEVSNCGAGS